MCIISTFIVINNYWLYIMCFIFTPIVIYIIDFILHLMCFISSLLVADIISYF